MKSLSLAVLLTFMVAGINAQPPACSTVGNFDWIPAEYQTDPASVSDPEGTPLGFRRGLTIPNPENMEDPPCLEFTLQNSSQYVEVRAQTASFSGSRFCVTLLDSNVALTEPICGQGQVDYCGNVPGSSTTLWALFDCDASCDLSDLVLYYRVVISDSLVTDLENWCINNRTDDFPSSLLMLIPPTEDHPSFSSHPSLTPSSHPSPFPSDHPSPSPSIPPSKITTSPESKEGAMVTHPLSLIALLSFLFAIAYLRHYLNL